MKHLFTLVAAAMVAMSAQAAENTFVQNSVNTPVDISKGISLKPAPISPRQKAAKHVKAENTSFECFLGDFVHSQWCLDPESYNDWIGSNCGLKVLDNGDGTVTIKNVLGYGDIQAAYDADEEALVASSGQFLFESKYGNVGLFSFAINDDDEVDFTDDDLLFYLDDENRFEILNDGIAMVLLDGNYAGSMLNDLYMFNQFDRVNATMTYKDYYKDDIEIGVSIDGDPEDGYVDVYGFGDVSCVAIMLDGDNVSIPEGQGVFYYRSYGMFYVYPIEEVEGEIADIVDGEVTGSYNPETKTITLGSFCIWESENNSLYDVYYSPSITWLQQDNPVGIEQLNVQRISRVFDLQGRLVNNLSSGRAYINGTTKIMVK